MQDCFIVLNPCARAARSLRVEDPLRLAAKNATLRLTSAPGEAESLAREAVQQGFRTIVAAGGDGTVNEVLRGMVGSSARLGILPLGTVNVLARELQIPLDWEEALSRILQGRSRWIDIGWANEAPFIQLAGVGFDAEVVSAVTPKAKNLLGPLAYVSTALRLLGQPQPRFRVTPKDATPIEASWVLLGIGRFYGGPIPLFPNADPADGLLDVLVIKKLSWKSLSAWIAALLLGSHTTLPEVEYLQTTHLHVDGGAAFELDGEARGRGPVHFHISPQHLQILF